MFTLVEARLAEADIDDLEVLHRELSALLGALRLTASAETWRVLVALAELVFVEIQVREQHVDATVRRLLDEPG
jgi:hypothetical protein